MRYTVSAFLYIIAQPFKAYTNSHPLKTQTPSTPPSPGRGGIQTTPDGASLAYDIWSPPETPRSVIVIVHGYAEHSGRHAPLAAHFVAQGHAVWTYDQRGHGRSSGRRAYAHTFDDYLDDLDAMLGCTREQFPGQPLFLFGHSMGGAVSTLYCLERQAALKGLILSSPALKLPDVAPLLQRFSSVIGRLVPRLPTVKLNLKHLSRDAGVVAQAAADPLYYHGRMPARTGAELVRATRRINARMETFTLPVLLFHGTADRLTDPTGSTELYSRARSTDKTLALYPGLFHETFNEPEKNQVREEIAEWLDERV